MAYYAKLMSECAVETNKTCAMHIDKLKTQDFFLSLSTNVMNNILVSKRTFCQNTNYGEYINEESHA